MDKAPWVFFGIVATVLFQEPTRIYLARIGRLLASLADGTKWTSTDRPPLVSPPQVAHDRISGLLISAQLAADSMELKHRTAILLEVRDSIREQITAANRIYNSEMDELQKTLRMLGNRNPGPASESKMRNLLAKSATKWPSKLEELDRIRHKIAAEWNLRVPEDEK